MVELVEVIVPILFGIGLVYGLVITLRYWNETISTGASADEFAHHR